MVEVVRHIYSVIFLEEKKNRELQQVRKIGFIRDSPDMVLTTIITVIIFLQV